MLTLNFIKENREKVLAGLQKRNLKNAQDLLDSVLQLDIEKREAQTVL